MSWAQDHTHQFVALDRSRSVKSGLLVIDVDIRPQPYLPPIMATFHILLSRIATPRGQIETTEHSASHRSSLAIRFQDYFEKIARNTASKNALTTMQVHNPKRRSSEHMVIPDPSTVHKR